MVNQNDVSVGDEQISSLRRRLADCQGRLRDAEERYELVSQITSTCAFALRLGPGGNVRREWVSGTVAGLSGNTFEELDAAGWESVLHPADRADVVARFRSLRDGTDDLADFRILTKGGEIRWLCAYVRAVPPESGRGATRVVGAVQDVTERRRAEDLRAGENCILKRMAAGASLQDLLAESVRVIEEQAPGMLCTVLLLDEDGQRLRHGAAPSLPPEYARVVDGFRIGPRAGSCGTAAFRRERVVVEDTAVDPLWDDYRDAAVRFGLRACWSQPILAADGSLLGTFAMYYRQPRRPSPQEIRLIEEAARLAAIVVERKRAEQTLFESERHYRELAERNARLVREVDHRVRNNLAGLLGLVDLTEKRAADVTAFAAAFRARLTGLAAVHQLLVDADWRPLSLGRLVRSSLESMAYMACHGGELVADGPDLSVGPNQAQALAMILTEWFTNSCKYGARSVPGGAVEIRWEALPAEAAGAADVPAARRVRLRWKERGGPPVCGVGAPSLGTDLVRGLVAHELHGSCTLAFPAEGAEYAIEFPARADANS